MKNKRWDLKALYEIIRELKATKLSTEARKKYTLLRIELVKFYIEFEQARNETWEQSQEDFQEILSEWLNAEIDLNLKVFSTNDYIDFISSNDLEGNVEDLIYQLMVIDESTQVD